MKPEPVVLARPMNSNTTLPIHTLTRNTHAHCLRIDGGLPHLVASQLQHQP
jgi:hypothetical protein